MKYTDAKPFLYSDGSWRDVYILDTKPEDAERFIEFVRPTLDNDNFFVDGDVEGLPPSYAQILKRVEEQACLLSIPVGRSYLNCHFFSDSELELDLVPKEYDNESDWNDLDSFLQKFADTMGKDVIVTPENCSNEVLIRYSPSHV